ncbi:ATP synthase F0 subunit B [Desulfosarcina sp.]|uniref:ATP synthase F0 subunit B n=1 Tax=Desulfosarcina sp. TaxID=2027861 RepID=UPI0029B583EC|nr:ATP synthase F0 subunit B [Desulfosarcina sp.]MDX2455370.1 ATP synthase F0 subunit B [Desulfosarcina sp.]
MVVQLLSFIVFMFILNRVMIRPLRSSAHDREIYIENLSAEISNAQKEMDAITTQIESQETSARQAAHNIQKEIVTLGSQEANSILKAAKQDVVALRQQTTAETKATLSELRKTLAKEAGLIAVNFMEKALSRRLNP